MSAATEATLKDGSVITIESHDPINMSPVLVKEFADFIKRVLAEEDADEHGE